MAVAVNYHSALSSFNQQLHRYLWVVDEPPGGLEGRE
jgi:hypothetical protein